MDKISILTEDGAGASLLRTILRLAFRSFLQASTGALRAPAVLHRSLPTIVLGNSGGETDKVIALEAGPGDYVVKPFAAREPTTRLHGVLRRRGVKRVLVVGFDNIPHQQDGKELRAENRDAARRVHALVVFLSNVDLSLKREMLLIAVRFALSRSTALAIAFAGLCSRVKP